MSLIVREMTSGEPAIIVDYFYAATPEQLDLMGVDPSRMPARDAWIARFESEIALPPEKKQVMAAIWLLDGRAVGISTCDKIVYGEQARMHLHVLDPERRQKGIGTEGVRKSAALYFVTFKLKRLFCEPNALNTAPNRTLQRAGFTFVKTYMTVPGFINYRMPVTRWVLDVSPAV